MEKKSTRSRKTRCKRREKLLSKKHTKTSSKDIRDTLTLDTLDSLNSSISSSSLTDSDGSPRRISAEDIRDANDYYHSTGIRNTLRLAVARSRKNSTRQSGHNVDLKERLLRKDLEFTGNQFSNPSSGNVFHDAEDDDDDDVVICEPENEIQCVPDDSADSSEEKELRLIALKSAVLKKHMERKRRNAEAAYSPTDFDDIISSCVVNSEDKLADLEVVDLDEDDSQNGCVTASPIASPQLMMLDDGQEDSSQMVDCKPIDMDIANSDSEDTGTGALNSWNAEMSCSIPYPPYPPNDIGNTYPYGLYLPDFNTNSLNPPPPGVDDYEEMKPPLTMNFGQSHNAEAQDMDVEYDDFEPIETFPTTCKIYNSDKEATSPQELKMEYDVKAVSSNSYPIEDENQEEEEEALRALLLSKFNSPKNQKKSAKNLNQASEVEKENSLDHQVNKDTNKKTVKPTEAILKEAVKRLKVVGMCKEDNRNELHSDSEVRRDICGSEKLVAWDNQPQQACINDIPMPRFSPTLEYRASPKESKEINTITLECLKRKVKELKNHKALDYNGAINDESSRGVSPVISIPGTGINKSADLNLEQTEKEPGFGETASVERTVKPLNAITNLDEDTKRRLQKLKDEILNATLLNSAETSQELPFITNIAANTKVETSKDSCTLKPTNPNAINIEPKEETLSKKDTNIITTKDDWLEDKAANTCESKAIIVAKTMKPNSNENKQGGTAAISLNKTALKENNLNNVNKVAPKTKAELNAVSIKTNQDTMKVVRTLNKTTVSIKTKETKPTAVKNLTQTSPKPLTAAPKISPVKPLPTYSMLRTTKIVKPNKVINTNIDLKRKVVLIKSDQTAATPTKLVKSQEPVVATTALAKTAKSEENSRLITSMDQVRHMCNVAQLVISIQNSSNESSGDEWADCDTMYKPLYDYNDISSPLSLHMESPCLTPTRSNSPIESFEEKTNVSKKTKRSPITFAKETTAPKTPILAAKVQNAIGQSNQTPVVS